MTVRKLSDGRWIADIKLSPSERYRKRFDTKAEATRYEAHIRSQSVGAAWNPAPDDKRSLVELVHTWYEHHGQYLSGAKSRLSALLRIAAALKNPQANKLLPSQFLFYRSARKLSAKTLNNELGYVNAMYGYLHKTGQISYESPLLGVKPIKIKERELAYLTTAQITELVALCRDSGSRSLFLLVQVLLATGCRWSEAQCLQLSQVGHRRITFTNTKSGKNRTVPISEGLEVALREYQPSGQGRLFAKAIKSLYLVLNKCSFDLPRGQAAHVLRHTYASHFIMNGGDILTLQKILGHSTVALTMRYSHLSPDHLLSAVQFSPAGAQKGLIQ